MSVGIYPFLAVAVTEIVDSLRVPHFPDTEQMQRQEPVLSHDHEVDEETGGCLDHTDLTIRHRNKPVHRESHLDRCRSLVASHGTCSWILTFNEHSTLDFYSENESEKTLRYESN